MGLLQKLFSRKSRSRDSTNRGGLNVELPGDGTFGFDIVGESKYQDNLRQIAGPKTPEGKDYECVALVVCEDNNLYDSLAVKVMINDLVVGYFPKDYAPRYRQQLERKGVPKHSAIVRAKIVGGFDNGRREGHYGVKLDVTLS